MNMVSFDTLKLARRLREAGMPSEQAEAVAEAEAEALGEFIQSHLATKQDIADLKQEISDCRSELKQDITNLKQEIGDCRSELKQDIANLRGEVKQDIINATRWNIGAMFALVAITLAILRLTN